MRQNDMCLEMPAHCKYLSVASGFIRSAASMAGFEEDGVEAIEIAAMEAVENVIDHAVVGRPGTVRLEIHQTRDSLVVDVKDRGVPWPKAVLNGKIGREMPPPDSARGRGLAMMRALMDDVIPRQAPDGTKTLRLIKRLSSVPAADQGTD